MIKLKNFQKSYIWLLLLIVLMGNLAFISKVFATTYTTQTQIAENNMLTSGASEVALSFKTSASGGGTALTLTFNGWTGGSAGAVNATQPVTAGCALFNGMAGANLPTGSSVTASGNAGTGVITFSGLSALAASTAYCVTLSSASAVTNPTAAGVSTVSIVAGNDDSTVAIDTISNDQYTVSATVAPTFTLSLPSTTDALGTLSAAALNTSTGVAATVSTNANTGWFLWAEDSQAGLHSATESKTINTVSVGSNHAMNGGTIGTEAYALGVTTANATTNYADAGGTTGGGLSTSTFYEIATNASPANSVAVDLKELADISAITPAANDYSDIITIVGAGSF
jgi:hypothetical protein